MKTPQRDVVAKNKLKRDRIIESLLLGISLLLAGYALGLYTGCALR